MKHKFSRYIVPAISLAMRDRVVNEKSALFRYMSKKGKCMCSLLGDEKSAKKRLGKQGQGWGHNLK